MKQIIQNLLAAVTGFLSNLTTTDKSSLVAAINEVDGKITKITVGKNAPSSPNLNDIWVDTNNVIP